ncbi:MAG TPA: redox-sensing transcriptional repressor Rex [Candidatus Omnitrophota bacterium]|nr:redox-sensing transcriptional repressor Rex [Candidatus Omnitrophota bacterium]
MKKFPQRTVTRAFMYLRALDSLIEEGKAYVSSGELAAMTALTDVQIRKDISVFGKAGKPRVGYDTRRLKQLLEEYVVQNVVHVVLFGVGNLGSAILRYPGFQEDKIKMVAAFDSDPNKVDKAINGISIYSLDKAKLLIQKKHVEIGVIAVPKQASQQIADLLVSCGIQGIVNFSPTTITVPKGIFVKNIDLAVEFLSLFWDMNAKKAPRYA